MQQYYLKYIQNENDIVSFDEEQSHHIVKVMRMKNNDRVYVVDKDVKKFLVSIEIMGNKAIGHVIEKIESKSEMGLKIYIAQGMIKGDRWDYFLQKSCEFGATDIIPLVLKRNVVKVTDGFEKKLERFNKIAQEASEQSKRDILPVVHQAMNLKELVKIEADLKLVAYEASNLDVSLKELIKSEFQSVLFVAGSEGGLDKEEVTFLQENGFHVVGLGPRILRAESASIYFLSSLSYEKGMI